MMADKYDSRVAELFKSGKATPAHWAELVEAIGCASEKDTSKVKAIHKAIGYSIADYDDKPTPLAVKAAADAATSEDGRMRVLARHRDAEWQKAERAQDRRWEATKRRLKIGSTTCRAARAR